MRTPLFDLHVQAGAKMVEFGGWEMPVRYVGIAAEHRQVRTSAGFFDLSHMGRLRVTGAGAAELLQYAMTNDAAGLPITRVHYSLLCNWEGGVRDDLLVYRLAEDEYLLVANASNRAKVLEWFDQLKQDLVGRKGDLDVVVRDETLDTVMIGVQGPRSEKVLQPLVDLALGSLKYYQAGTGGVLGSAGLISRTGYTGEDGFEVIVPVDAGIRLWRRLMESPSRDVATPAGLGARDTLRLEAGMPLYGHELSESINPLEAGLGRFVRLDKPELVGRESLLEVSRSGPGRRLVGLVMPDRVIARHETPVAAGGEVVGYVTSGSYAPYVDRSVAMALVAAEPLDRALSLEVVVRGKEHPAQIVELPFYRRGRGAG